MTESLQSSPAADQPRCPDPSSELAVGHVLEALEHLHYGSIQLTVHDGKLVQVDVTERRRFP